MSVLASREQRVALIEQFIQRNNVIVSLRANYPGESKDNELTQFIIQELYQVMKETFDILEEYQLNQGEGCVYLFILNHQDGIAIKSKAIEIEESHPLGRLVDIDVYHKDIKSISRKLLKQSPRSCFLCQLDAFYCIRNRSHSIEDILQYINEVVRTYGKNSP